MRKASNMQGQQMLCAMAVPAFLRTWAGHVQPDAQICILHNRQSGGVAPHPFEVCSPAKQCLVPE